MNYQEKLYYAGYAADMAYSEEDKIYYGKVENISDLVIIESATQEGVYSAFVEAVEDYINTLKEVKNGSV